MTEPVTSTVPDHLSGERLDKVIAEMLGVSRSEARRLVEAGALVDGGTAGPADRVTAGQTIESPPPSHEEALIPERVEFGVLYEDEATIVVDKPPGVVVHPGAGNRKGTLAAGLVERYPELAGMGPAGRAGLVHRLDKETSGALLVARTDQAHQFFTGELKRRHIERVYLALVEGAVPSATGTVEAPIGRDPARPTRRAVTHGGKPARTHYRLVEDLRGQASLLEITLETGRTHQIRVHMAAISHPVAGDRTYGASRVDSPRIFLHSSRLGFTHPESGRRVEVDSPLPEDLTAALAGLRGDPR